MALGMRKVLAAGIAIAMIAGAAAAMGCAPNTPARDAQAASESAAATGTSAQWASKYPLEFQSSYQTRVNAKGIVIGHSVENLKEICEAPVERDANGDPVYDASGKTIPIKESFNTQTGTYDIGMLSDSQLEEMNLRSGCVSCKTSRFNDIYARQGAAAFGNAYNAEARAIVADDYFDCALCHDGEPSARNVQPSLMYFPALGEGLADRLDERLGVCAQCHNSYDYRSLIRTDADLRKYKAYRNGYDVDGLFETCWEDGVNFDVDPTTGIAESYLLHPTIELYMGTKMQLLGVTCVDCHMPQSTADDGTAYANHFSANSPIESEDSLAYCLNCHESQGIATTREMAEFVRAEEAEMAAGTEALEARIADFRSSLEKAVAERGAADASLDDAKKLYAKATWYDMCLVTGPSESPGSQAAMLDWRGILEKANAACNKGVALLG